MRCFRCFLSLLALDVPVLPGKRSSPPANAPEAKRVRSDDGTPDHALSLLTSKFDDQMQLVVQMDTKLAAYMAESELKFKVLQHTVDSNADSIAERLLALEEATSGPNLRVPITAASGQPPPTLTPTRMPTTPAMVYKNGVQQALKTHFSSELLEFLRDATMKLSGDQQFVQFCDTHNIHAGALVRRLRKVYRGRQFDGAWWWTPGTQRRYPAASRN